MNKRPPDHVFKASRIAISNALNLRILEYNKNPKKCKNCFKPIKYSKRNNIFCNSACSGSYNTKGRKLTNRHKQNISIGMECSTKKNPLYEYRNGEYVRNDKGQKKVRYTRISIKNCTVCDKIFVTQRESSRKTCCRKHSIIARTNRTYLNGSRKTIKFKHPIQGIIILESSWELKIANLLIDCNINWIRPKPLSWKDENNKEHLYYPDFYLVDYDVYLDPKNPYCIQKDEEKMKYILDSGYQVIYGDISIVEKYINDIGM